MEYQTPQVASRMHPLMIGAAASVVLVSLLGAAALTGILPSSHSTPAPTGVQSPTAFVAPTGSQTVTPVSASRFVTADGRVLEEVPNVAQTTAVRTDSTTTAVAAPRAVPVHHKPVRHVVHHQQQVALNDSVPKYEPPVYQQAQAPVQTQPVYQPQQQPQPASVFGNVNPVQTGVGAVIGGLLGSQVGKGNGRTLATVAGVIAGGYAGNEISHGRSPIPTW